MTQPTIDLEAQALAQCYALLIRKAQERRARLAAEAAAATAENNNATKTDTADTKKAPK